MKTLASAGGIPEYLDRDRRHDLEGIITIGIGNITDDKIIAIGNLLTHHVRGEDRGLDPGQSHVIDEDNNVL